MIKVRLPRAAFFCIWNSFPGGGTSHNYLAIADNPGATALMTDARTITRERFYYLPPKALSVRTVSSDSVTLAWSEAPGAVGYLVAGSPNGADRWTIAGTSSGPGVTISGLSPATKRYFRVRALFALRDSDATAPLALEILPLKSRCRS